jgi:RNA polymerase sigma-70 factor, ECF subfamily
VTVAPIASLPELPAARLRAAADGEADAIAFFVDQCWPRMHRIAVLVTAGAPDAEDIAQDATLRALGGLSSLDLDRPIEPWLDRVAGNAARDWLRKRASRREVLVDETPEPAQEIGWPSALAVEHLSGFVVEALARLNDVERTVIVLRHLLDLRATEIAELLDIPTGTVRSLDYRALKKLREQLDPKEVADAR